MPEETLSVRTLRGVKWSYASTLVNAFLQVVLTAVLARLLAPSAFGLVAMASLVLRFGQYFAQMGLASAIVQHPHLESRDISGANWLCWLLGAVFSLTFYFSADIVSAAFHSPGLVPVVRMMSVNFLLVGGSVVPLAMLRRSLRFRPIAVIEIASYIASYGGVGLALAYHGAGVWSLVAAALAQSSIQLAIAAFVARDSVPLLPPTLPSAQLVGFGSRVSLIGILEFLATNLDSFGVGSAIGATQLGFYSRGYNLAYLPTYYLMNSLSRVLQSSYSRIQQETTRLRHSFLESVALLGAATIPLSMGVLGAAREVILVMLGPNWMPVVPVAMVLSIAAPLTGLTRLGETIAEATAQLNQKLAIRAAHVLLFVLILVALSRYGTIGFAVGFAVSEALVFVAYLLLSNRILGIGVLEYAKQLVPAILAGLAALTVARGLSIVFDTADVSPFVSLPVQASLAGIASLVVLVRYRRNSLWLTLRGRLVAAGAYSHDSRSLPLLRVVDILAGTTQPVIGK